MVRLSHAPGENGNAFRTDTYVEVDEELQKAFCGDAEHGGLGRRQSFSARGAHDNLSMELTEEDWNLFLSGPPIALHHTAPHPPPHPTPPHPTALLHPCTLAPLPPPPLKEGPRPSASSDGADTG